MFVQHDTFLRECRDELCLLGLPVNGEWQPSDAALGHYYRQRMTVNDVVRLYKPNVKRYENWVKSQEDEGT